LEKRKGLRHSGKNMGTLRSESREIGGSVGGIFSSLTEEIKYFYQLMNK
jgi:hypothetical protein